MSTGDAPADNGTDPLDMPEVSRARSSDALHLRDRESESRPCVLDHREVKSPVATEQLPMAPAIHNILHPVKLTLKPSHAAQPMRSKSFPSHR
jgi:hypothetical protein